MVGEIVNLVSAADPAYDIKLEALSLAEEVNVYCECPENTLEKGEC